MNPLFDLPQMSLDKKIRLITTFSGIGAQEMAMKAIGADFEIYKAVEFDRFAINSYNAVHGTSFPVLDICNVHAGNFEIVDKEHYNYIFVYSFPCQALSVAGKMGGMKENSGTTSSLLWEIKRILSEFSEDELPDVLLMENVPQVHSEKNMPDFNRWIDFLRSRGYVNYYQDLNARDFGIPQNRERCFMVSVLSDKFIDFEFPKPIKLDRVMKDFLESEVDERYYINNEKAEKLIEQLVENGTLKDNKRCVDLSVKNPKEIEVANCICARTDRGISNIQSEGSGVVEFVGNIQRDVPQGYSGSVYKTSGISPCCLARDYKDPILVVDKYKSDGSGVLEIDT